MCAERGRGYSPTLCRISRDLCPGSALCRKPDQVSGGGEPSREGGRSPSRASPVVLPFPTSGRSDKVKITAHRHHPECSSTTICADLNVHRAESLGSFKSDRILSVFVKNKESSRIIGLYFLYVCGRKVPTILF